MLGYIFRNIRHEKHLTLRQVTEATGIDFSYLSKIETGVVSIQRHQSITLCRFYEVDRDKMNMDCPEFFSELKRVLHANIEHDQHREKIQNDFLEKYKGLKNTKYLPYLHFVELEKLSYQGCKDERFYYLFDFLTPELLRQPYQFFLILRKMYHYSQEGDLKKAEMLVPKVKIMMERVEGNYKVFGYFYLLATNCFLGNNIGITELYSQAKSRFISSSNYHFAMLTDIMYGIYLIMHREYRYAIKFYMNLLENPDYAIPDLSKEAVVYNIGEAYFHLYEVNLALEYYRKAYGLVPQRSTAFFIVYCLYLLDREQEAVEFIDRSVLISNQNKLYTDLLGWFRKYITQKRRVTDEIIKRLERLERKYKAQVDYSLRMVLLRIKADFYHQFKNFEKENIYLRKIIDELKDI